MNQQRLNTAHSLHAVDAMKLLKRTATLQRRYVQAALSAL